MNRIEFIDTLGRKIVISQPSSGGGSYHINIDDAYHGLVVWYADQGWTACPNRNSLQKDDLDILIDLVKDIEKENPTR